MKEPIEPEQGPPKVFVERFYCRIINGMHVISFASGEEKFNFVLQLPHAKTMGRAITKQIEEIEEKLGRKIKDMGLSDEPVISPIHLEPGEDNQK